MSSYKVLGFGGPIGVGKDTAADIAKDIALSYGLVPTRMAFADSLKQIAKEHFGWDGEKDDPGRLLLTTLGTEGGRAYNEEIWIEKVQAKCEAIYFTNPHAKHLFILSDVRFRNESQWVVQHGITVRIRGVRRGVAALGNLSHATENSFSKCVWSREILNEGSIELLTERVHLIVRNIATAWDTAEGIAL